MLRIFDFPCRSLHFFKRAPHHNFDIRSSQPASCPAAIHSRITASDNNYFLSDLLDMAYVACGRFDAYIEQGISLWDIAAGWILIETAGGRVDMKPRTDMKDKYSIIASNGVIDLKL